MIFEIKIYERKSLKPKKNIFKGRFLLINPQAPVAQKIADEVVFRRFQGEGVELF